MLARTVTLPVLFSLSVVACGGDDTNDGDGTMATDDPSGATDETTPEDDEMEPGMPSASTSSEPSASASSPPEGSSPAPSAEPPADTTYGALSVEFLAGCAVGPQVYNFPDDDVAPVDAEARTAYWVDGEVVDGDEISVNCEWVGATASDVSVTIGDRGTASPRNVGMSFRAGVGEPGTGTFRIHDGELSDQYGTEQGGEQCEYTLLEVDAATGSVWGEFSCPSVVPLESTTEDACAIGQSFFYLTNCSIL